MTISIAAFRESLSLFAAVAQATLSRPSDASKLKKHITLVADRLHKGQRPLGAREKDGGAVAQA